MKWKFLLLKKFTLHDPESLFRVIALCLPFWNKLNKNYSSGGGVCVENYKLRKHKFCFNVSKFRILILLSFMTRGLQYLIKTILFQIGFRSIPEKLKASSATRSNI